MKREELKKKNERFLEQYLAGKASLHTDRLVLPTEEELDASEAEFDRMVAKHKQPTRLLSLLPWLGTAVAAMLVMAFLLWQDKPIPVTEKPVPMPTQTVSLPIVQEPIKPVSPIKPNKSHKPNRSHKVHKPQPTHEEPVAEPSKPMLAQAEPQPEEEAPVIPPEKQALADIFLAEEALQVAYEIRAQQEAIRAYAASLTGEELPKPIIVF